MFYARGNAILKRVEKLAPKKSCAWRQREILSATLHLGGSIAEAKQAGIPHKIIKRVASPFARRIERLVRPCTVKKSKS